MGKRSKRPKWIKGEGRPPTPNQGKSSNDPMKFKRGIARKPKPDTGKKITKDKSNTPNPKYKK